MVFGYFPGGWVGWLGWVVGLVVVVKSNNSANSAQLSYASQLELSLAIIDNPEREVSHHMPHGNTGSKFLEPVIVFPGLVIRHDCFQ